VKVRCVQAVGDFLNLYRGAYRSYLKKYSAPRHSLPVLIGWVEGAVDYQEEVWAC